ncbi:hypothetical protein ACKKBF_B35975 [Auxenochlorella protothecoides x Auxenochlorella symbiontica]
MSSQDLPGLMPILPAEMPWLFPKVNFRLFKIEAGEIGFDESSCVTPSDFMAMVQRDQTAAAHLLDALAAQGVAGGRDEPSGGRDEPSSASTLLVDIYDECIAALCDSPLTVGALEVMHSQVSCRKLSLDLASGFVNHAILCLEEEEQESLSSQHPRLVRLFAALLRPLISHHPGLLLSCPALEGFCLRNLQHSEGIALFQFLKQQQELYL